MEKCSVHCSVAVCALSGQVAGRDCPIENIHYVSMLVYFRELPRDYLIRDAQYTYWPLPLEYEWPESGAVYSGLLKEGHFSGHSDTDHPVNECCILHRRIDE